VRRKARLPCERHPPRSAAASPAALLVRLQSAGAVARRARRSALHAAQYAQKGASR